MLISAPIILISTILFLYWFSRTVVLLYGSPQEIASTLDGDLRRGHAVLSAFR